MNNLDELQHILNDQILFLLGTKLDYLKSREKSLMDTKMIAKQLCSVSMERPLNTDLILGSLICISNFQVASDTLSLSCINTPFTTCQICSFH